MINLWDHLSGRCPKTSLGEFEWKKGTKIKGSSGDLGYFLNLVDILATFRPCGYFGYFFNLAAILATFQSLWRLEPINKTKTGQKKTKIKLSGYLG